MAGGPLIAHRERLGFGNSLGFRIYIPLIGIWNYF